MAHPAESLVLDALSEYRARIGEANRRAMSILIPQIEAADMGDPELFESPEEEEEMRIAFVHHFLGVGSTDPPIKRASDVLDNWDSLVSQLSLDGVTVDPDPEWRATQHEKYRSAILECLSHLECPTGQWALPSDFEVLMQHVDSLDGPGWYRLRDHGERIVFWPGWGLHGDSHSPGERIQKKVRTGQAITDWVRELEEYDVAGGWECSAHGNESYCYAFYCRPKGDENQGWSWRYAASMGQFGNELFDDLVAVLKWNTRNVEVTGHDLEITAEEVFQS
ncbi:fad binding domain-containing [Fusarium albosuccineum]|uniref:Fad binding domain-containing n=1 Tax=Fusarium albosuccineum TaxID=1237068 RepID=A0A8H4KCW4_9HYPO|nr:fad binding domain-containing [Fusarium albosuccineum]